MVYKIQTKKYKDEIKIVHTLEEAKQLVNQLELEDKRNNMYTFDFYDIVRLENEK